MPHRAPGSTGKTRQDYLSGKPIRYYRPRGSAEIRHLIDGGVPHLHRQDAAA